MTLSRLLLFFILFFIYFQLNAGESIQSFINKVEKLNKTEFKLFKENYLSSNSSTKEKDEIIKIIDKQFENDLMGRFVLLVKLVDDKPNISEITKIWANYHLSCFLADNKLYEEALKRNKVSYLLSCKNKENKFKYLTLINTAGIYFVQKKYSKAFNYYKKCLNLSDSLAKASNYNNLALCQKRLKNYESSMYYFKKGSKLLEKKASSAQKEIYFLIQGNIGSLYCEIGKLDSSDSYLNEELVFYKKQNINNSNAIYCLVDILLLKQKQNKNTITEFNEIIERIKKINEIENQAKVIADLESSLLSKLTKSQQETFNRTALPIQKKYFKKYIEKQNNINRVLFSDKIYSLKKSSLLEHKQFKLEKKNNQYKNILLFVATLILFIMLFFLLKIQKQRKIQLRNEQLIAQQNAELFKTQQQLLQNELNFQQQQLQALSINLKIKTETEEQFLQKIKAIKKQKILDIDSIVNELQLGIQNLKEIDRKLYLSNSENNQVNQVFLTRLKDKHSNLSENEIAFCQFCYVNLSSKEISQITGQSEGAVRVYKNKIKNKLLLKKEDDLNEYLKRISKSEN